MNKQLDSRWRPRLLAGGIAFVTLASVAVALPPPSVRVIRAVLADNGDADGWADTRETVQMRIEVRNLTGVALTGVVALLETDDPKIAAIPHNRIAIGSLSQGEIRLSDEGFTFVVGDVVRTSTEERLSVTFRVKTHSDAYTRLPDTGPWDEVTLDLDLDLSGGAGPTTYFESFESGFGGFTTMHIDETLNPPPEDINNHWLGELAADGYRCQYSNIEWSIPEAPPLHCYPSQDGVPDTYYWHTTSERAFSGEQSLHYGVFLDPAALYSTPRAQLEAIRTLEPVNLGWANVCSLSRTVFCTNDADCPSGETCAPAVPRFTFKHQISMIDGRTLVSGPNSTRQQAPDRGVVAVQLASPQGGVPVGEWIRLDPFVNVYDTQANTNYFNCTFDPIDDGNTEDDFFDPTDPLRSLGPSSTCFPQFDFVFQGSSVGSDTTSLGKASDGPGLLGVKGPGAWVEPAFDLSRFRGRRLRLRFLTTGIKVGSAPLWHPIVNNTAANPDPRDDGWFIDDVRVTDALASSAAVAADTKDNGGLPGAGDDGDDVQPDNCPTAFNPGQEDTDGDGVGDACDTCPFDFFDDRDGDGSCCPALADESDDPDADGLCGAADDCPDVFNAGGASYLLVAPGSSFAFGSVDSRVVTTSNGILVSTPVAGGPTVPLDGYSTHLWALTPDGSRVVYDLKAAFGGLRSVPVEGGPPVQLAEGDIRNITLGGEGPRVVYVDFYSNALFSVLLDGGTPLQLSVAEQGGVSATGVAVTPDGTQVVYRASIGGHSELYSVTVTGGIPVKLNAPLVASGHVLEFSITADGARAVYRADQDVNDTVELYSVPVAGGPVTKLSSPLVSGGDIVAFAVTPDGARAVYRADQDADESFELYSVPVAGGTVAQLNGPLVAGGNVDAFVVTPDAAHVLYRADEEADGVFELHAVPAAGGTVERLASGMALSSTTIAVSADSVHAVFAAHDAGSIGLFSVAIAGGSPVLLTESFAEPSFSIASDSATVAALGPGGMQVVPITGGSTTVLSGPLAPLDLIGPIAFSPDLAHVVFQSASPIPGLPGLFAAALGPDDGDGVPVACDCDDANAAASDPAAPEINDGLDNDCPGEPGRGLVDEIGECAPSSDMGFAFPAQQGATSYEVARAMASDFSVDCTSVTITDPWWEDPDVPPAGATYFYLVRALTPHAGSWGRDSAGVERAPPCAESAD